MEKVSELIKPFLALISNHPFAKRLGVRRQDAALAARRRVSSAHESFKVIEGATVQEKRDLSPHSKAAIGVN
jgi:hypothetical protein